MWSFLVIVVLASRGTDRLGDPLPPGAVARYGSSRFVHPKSLHDFNWGWRLQFHPTRSEFYLLSDGRADVGTSGWTVPTGERVFRRGETSDRAKATLGVVFADNGRLRLELPGTNHATVFDDKSNRLLHAVAYDAKKEVALLGVVGDRLAACERPTMGAWAVTFRRLADGLAVGPTIPVYWPKQAVLSPDGKTLSDVDPDTFVLQQYDTASGRLTAWCKLLAAERGETEPRWHVQPSADGRRLFVTGHLFEKRQKGYPGYPVGTVQVFDLATRRVIAKHTHVLDEADADRLMHGRELFPSGAFDEPTVSDDGRFIAWRGRSWRVSLRHLESGRVLLTPTATDRKQIAFSPDGRRMAATSDGTVQVLDTATGQPIRTDGAPGMTHFTHELSPDGARVAVTSYDGSVWVYDAATAEPLWHTPAGPGFYPHAHFDATGKFLLAEAGPEKVFARVYDATTGKPLGDEWRQFARTTPVVIGDGKQLRDAARSGGALRARVRDSATGKVLSAVPLDRPADDDEDRTRAVVTRDGTRVVAYTSKAVAVYDAVSGKRLASLVPARGRLEDPWPNLSADGRLVALTVKLDEDGKQSRIAVFDAATGREWPALPRGGSGPWSPSAFSPDGRYLVAWLSNSGQSRNVLLDTRSGVAVRELPRFASGLFPDNRSILLDAHTRGMERFSLEPLAWRVTPPPKPTADRLAKLRAQLAEPGTAGFSELLELGRHPAQAVPFLTAKLAEPTPEADRIDARIGQLGAKAFADREAATNALLEIGAVAAPALRAAAKTVTAAEVRARVAKLLAAVGDPALPINLRRLRADEVLEKCRLK